MSALSTYQLYNTIKLHFSEPKFTYSGKIPERFNQENFENRNDRMKFEKIWNRFSQIENSQDRLVRFFSAVFVYHPSLWIGDMADDINKYEVLLRERIKYNSNVVVAFKRDLEPIFHAFELSGKPPTLAHLFTSNVVMDGYEYKQIPEIVNMIPNKKMNPETVVILDFFFKFLNASENDIPVWKDICHRLKKFKTFMNITDKDLKEIRAYLKEKLNPETT